MKKSFSWAKDNVISRRSFVGLAAAATAALAVASQVTPKALAVEAPQSGSVPSAEGVQHIRTMCRGCGKMECSCWVTVENGRAIKIEGDEANFGAMGNCCSKSQASLQAAYHPDRLRYPLKRTNPKTDNDPGWVRVSWEEALQDCADKFNEIKEQRGYNSMFSMCGTSRIYCMSSAAGAMPILNTKNTHQAYQTCKGPRHMATGFQSNRAYSWMATVDRPRVFVQWGGASELSNYDDSCRTTVEVASKADYHIIVDPRLTNLGKEADIWLPLRPGTDGAMALGWLNVIINNKLYNEVWAKRWTNLPFLVAVDMEATPGTQTKTSLGGPIMTKLLKESDLKEDGDQNKFMVWDSISDGMVWFDTATGLWQGEAPLDITEARDLPGHDAEQEHLVPGVKQGYVPDLSDFSRCDPLIDPQLEGSHTVTLKDGTEMEVRTVWDIFVEHVNHYDPETVAQICEVPAEDIIKAATIYATPLDPESGYGNGGIQYMLATEHAANAVQTCRCIDAIVGLTNNFDTPAGHRGATVGPFNAGQWQMRPAGGYTDPAAAGEMLGIHYMPMLPEMPWGDATACWDACNRDDNAQYPLYGGYCQSGDLMNMSNALWAWEGLKQLDFFLVLDLWHTPTSQMADYLLPVRHWLEVDCPRTGQGSNGMEGSHCKAIAPLAETWYDVDIMVQLCKHMGIEWAAGETDEEKWPDSIKLLDKSAAAYDALTKDYPGDSSWERWKAYFQEQGMQDMKAVQPDCWGSYRRFESGISGTQAIGEKPTRIGTPGLGTPTKKQEFWCTKIETYHPAGATFGDWMPGYGKPDFFDGEYQTEKYGEYTLPNFTEPPEGPVANPEYAAEYPFIMTTGRRIPVYFHSEHRQLPWCRELWPYPKIEINPADAAELGIEAGDWVWIETPRHKIRQVADLYYGVRPGTVNCEHQWWLPEFQGGDKGVSLININTLVNKDVRCPISGSTYLRAYNVNIYKATPENSPFGNPVPCNDEGVEMIWQSTDPRLKEWLPVYDNEESLQNYAERNGIQA